MNEMCPNTNGYVPKNELLGTYSLRMCKYLHFWVHDWNMQK